MKKRLISIDISCFSYPSFVARITALARQKISSYVCVANVHMLIEAYDNPDFGDIVNRADLVTPDGMPLAKGLKFLYRIEQERVAGMDLLPDLLKVAEQQKLRVYFYGGTAALQKACSAYIGEMYPALDAVGFHSPPFRALSVEEELNVIEMINASGANLILVALGCPKQERWMAGMKGKIEACMVGIGGALPVMLGLQKRAPRWMQQVSLEWLFRLSQEPKRLFKRYAVTNTKFIILMLKAYIKRGKEAV